MKRKVRGTTPEVPGKMPAEKETFERGNKERGRKEDGKHVALF